jgi:WD40 repeat protein
MKYFQTLGLAAVLAGCCAVALLQADDRGTTVVPGKEVDLTGGYRFAHFGRDGIKVVLSSNDVDKRHFARVYDARTGEPVTPPLKHEKSVWHASFSADGRRVVTAGADKTARVWDARTGEPVTPPLKHEGVVYHASFSADGRRVVTASWDKTARVWDAQTGKELHKVTVMPD